MKKILSAAMAMVLSLSFAACGKEEPEPTFAVTVPMLTEAPETEVTLDPAFETLSQETGLSLADPEPVETQSETQAPAAEETEAPPEETEAPAETLPTPSNLEGIQGVGGTIYNTGRVNVRKAPSARSDLVKTLDGGARVTVYEVIQRENAKWAHTNYGWIAQQYVKLEGPLPDPDPRLGIQGTVFNTETVNVRETPSVSAKKTAVLKRNTPVTVYETKTLLGMQWGRIDEGWVAMKYIQLPKGKVPPEAGDTSGGIEAVG